MECVVVKCTVQLWVYNYVFCYSSMSTSIIPSPAIGGKESYSLTIYDIQNQFIGETTWISSISHYLYKLCISVCNAFSVAVIGQKITNGWLLLVVFRSWKHIVTKSGCRGRGCILLLSCYALKLPPMNPLHITHFKRNWFCSSYYSFL